jgi:hypothetical protein
MEGSPSQLPNSAQDQVKHFGAHAIAHIDEVLQQVIDQQHPAPPPPSPNDNGQVVPPPLLEASMPVVPPPPLPNESDHFAASKKRKKSPAQLLSVLQRRGEKLREYTHRFNLERLDMNDCSDDIAITAFTNGLRDKDLVRTLYKHPPHCLDDVMTRAKTHMLASETLHPSSDEAAHH